MKVMELNFSDKPPPPVSPAELDSMVETLRQRIQVLNSSFVGLLITSTDSKFLSVFIRTKNYNLEGAFVSVQNYYAWLHRNRRYTEGIRPSSMLAPALNSNVIVMLKHHFSGVRVCVLKLRNWMPKKVRARELELSASYIFQEYIINDVEMQEKGLAVIIDTQGARMEHLAQFSMTELRKLVNNFQNGLPIRVAGLHLLNLPRIFIPLFKLGVMLLKDKIRKRVHIHYGKESLHNAFNKKLLPESLGGDLRENDATEKHVVAKILADNIPLASRHCNR